jgi:hypothetical protein
VRVEPESERHSDRLRAGAQQRHRAVDAAAHRDRDAALLGRRAEGRPERVRERVDGQLVAADGRRLEQGQARKRAVEALAVGLDDPAVVHREAHERPAPISRGVADQLHHRQASWTRKG